jgi:hypothetical protein
MAFGVGAVTTGRSTLPSTTSTLPTTLGEPKVIESRVTTFGNDSNVNARSAAMSKVRRSGPFLRPARRVAASATHMTSSYPLTNPRSLASLRLGCSRPFPLRESVWDEPEIARKPRGTRVLGGHGRVDVRDLGAVPRVCELRSLRCTMSFHIWNPR